MPPHRLKVDSSTLNSYAVLLQVGASSARLNPLAASFQPHASKTSLTVGPFADVSALEEAPSADISAAPTGRPSRSRDLPPRAPVASHSPHQMAHASSPGLLSPPALSSGALIPRGLAAGRQLETEEEPAAGLGGRGPESAFYASADLEDRQPVPSMEPVNVADVSETGGYGRGGREGSGEAGLTLRRSEAWAPIVEEPEEGGSGPSEMEVGAADMEIMPAGVGEPQRVLKAAEVRQRILASLTSSLTFISQRRDQSESRDQGDRFCLGGRNLSEVVELVA